MKPIGCGSGDLISYLLGILIREKAATFYQNVAILI